MKWIYGAEIDGKFLPIKELRTSLKELLMEAGFTQAELAEIEEIAGII